MCASLIHSVRIKTEVHVAQVRLRLPTVEDGPELRILPPRSSKRWKDNVCHHTVPKTLLYIVCPRGIWGNQHEKAVCREYSTFPLVCIFQKIYMY